MKEEEMQLVLVGGEGYTIEFKESLALSGNIVISVMVS